MQEFTNKVQECADQGAALARQLANDGIFEPLYLYCRPSEPGKPGRLMLVRDSAPVPPECKLVTGEALRANVPYANFFQWIMDRSQRAPILSMES